MGLKAPTSDTTSTTFEDNPIGSGKVPIKIQKFRHVSSKLLDNCRAQQDVRSENREKEVKKALGFEFYKAGRVK